MKRASLMMLLIVSSISYGDIWTETFDDGVGRLNQTSGNGESVFAWDSDNDAINGAPLIATIMTAMFQILDMLT